MSGSLILSALSYVPFFNAEILTIRNDFVKIMRLFFCRRNNFLLLLLLCLCSEKQEIDPAIVDTVKPEIINSVPHDSTAFTQGLLYRDGRLYESTGIVGQSTIRIVDTNGVVKTKNSFRKYLQKDVPFLMASFIRSPGQSRYASFTMKISLL